MISRSQRRLEKRSRAPHSLATFAVGILTTATVFAVIPTSASAQSSVAAAVPFATQQGGTYDGMPLFDGNPDHVDAYLNVLVDYVGIEGAIFWAQGQRGDFTILSGPNAGRIVPGAARFDEGVQGISTDFPAPIAIGQTWNSRLAKEVGQVIGEENLYQEDFLDSISTFNPMLSAPQQDIRINPLSGRLDEGFGEDPQHASVMIDQTSRGMSGIDAEGNDQGFWTKNMLDTKHYTGYLAQWFRRTSDNSISARALMEYYVEPARKSFESGAIDAMLTTFGRTNGVPNIISPLIADVQQKAPWGGVYSVNDINGHRELSLDYAFSNGFDTKYTPSQDTATALMAIADAGSIAVNDPSGSPKNAALLQQLDLGTYGVTVEDVEELAKTQIVPLVRMGLFNERDAQGYPVNYPFLDLSAASGEVLDASRPEHQSTALRAAQESIVLLKNDQKTLPLKDDASLGIVGPVSDARFRTTRAVATPQLAGAGLTPLQGIAERAEKEVFSATDGNVVALRAVANGQYLRAGDGDALTATGPQASEATSFEAFAWGQEGYSFRSEASGKWLQYLNGVVTVGGTQEFGTSRTEMPYRLRQQNNDDGTVSFVVENFSTSFGGGFERRNYTNGRYLTVDPATGQVGVTGVLTDAPTAAALNTPSTKFTIDTVQAAGSEITALERSERPKYAVVVIGAPPRHSAGEGSDRSELELGPDQYALVDRVAQAYPRRTIVVISNTTPVAVDSIQKNNKVAAIVQVPDNGEYGNLALGQMLFGDYAPSGRLSQTWYASTDALPPLDEYSIPEGQDALIGLDDLDPRFTVDMSNGDPYDTELTYAHTEAPVTYEFGYGLSYTDFAYSRFSVNAPAEGSSTWTATVTIRNKGTVDASEVVQLYAANPGASYGDAAPKRQLVAFGKVDVPARSSQQVTLEFDASALALWNTNTDKMEVEAGQYRFEVGHSSNDIRATRVTPVRGASFGNTDASSAPINVFDHSFAASGVAYREASKQNTVEGLHEDDLVHGYYSVLAKTPGAWTAIDDVVMDGASKALVSVATQNEQSSLELRVDRPDGPVVGTASFGPTGVSEYVIPGSRPEGDVPVREIGYRTLTIDLPKGLKGRHDLYVVFGAKDVRVRDLQLVDDSTGPEVTVKTGVEETIGAEGRYARVSFKLNDPSQVDRLTVNGVEKDLTNNVWSDLNGVVPGQFGAVEGENVLVVSDIVGNSTTLKFVLDTTGPEVTVKSEAGASIGSEGIYTLVSFKLHDPSKVSGLRLNDTAKDLTDNEWSDLNAVKPGSFGAVEGSNKLVVADALGNETTIEFTLTAPAS